MKDNNKLMPLVIILAIALIFETVYLFGGFKTCPLMGKGLMEKGMMGHHAKMMPRQQRFQEDYMPSMETGVEWQPLKEMARIQQQINGMFKDSLSRALQNEEYAMMKSEAGFVPNISVQETGTDYLVKADLPGMDKADIGIEIKGNLLTISGERKKESEIEKKGYYRQEESYGYFSRSITLPENANMAQVSAEYNKGVLTIRIPKKVSGESGMGQPIKIKVD